MKKYPYYSIALVLLSIIFLFGCQEAQQSVNLRMRFSVDESLRSTTREVISPEGESLSITGYIVTGSGPNSSSFSITTNSTQIEVNSLVIGTWNITVKGVNQQGTTIATGSKTHHLTTRANVVEINLNQFSGEGYVDIGFNWEETSFSDMGLILKLKAQGEVEQDVSSAIDFNNSTGTARYYTCLPTGSYDLIFNLLGDGEVISGGVVVLRVLDGKTSSKEISLIIDKESPEATAFVIKNSVSEPVRGTIEGMSSLVLPNTNVTANFNHTGGGGTGTLTYSWFLDGVKLSSSTPSVTFKTFSGNHRLDVIAQTPNLGSVGGVSFPFRASVAGREGVPVTVDDISQGERDPHNTLYKLDGVKAAAFLRDGRLLIASNMDLQLCEIKKDKLIVLKSFGQTSYPVAAISSIEVDTLDDIVITTSTTSKTVAFYNYDKDNADLQLITTLDKNRGELWTTASILDAVIDAGNNRIFIASTDPAKKRLYFTAYSKNSIGTFSSSSLASAVNGNHLAINKEGTRILVTRKENSSIYTYAVNNNIDGSFMVSSEISTTLNESVTTDKFRGYPVGDYLHLNLDDGFYLFNTPTASTPYWGKGQRISTSNQPVFATCYDNNLNSCWFIENPSERKITKVNLFSGTPMGVVGSQDLPASFNCESLSYSPKGDFLVAVGENRLLLLRIGD